MSPAPLPTARVGRDVLPTDVLPTKRPCRSNACHATEDVVLRVASPSAALSGRLRVAGPLLVVAGRHVDDIVEERLVRLAQVGGLGGPIVHLHVDVRVDVGVPRCLGHVVPDALQVGGQGHAAGGAGSVLASVPIDETSAFAFHHEAALRSDELPLLGVGRTAIRRLEVGSIALVGQESTACLEFTRYQTGSVSVENSGNIPCAAAVMQQRIANNNA